MTEQHLKTKERFKFASCCRSWHLCMSCLLRGTVSPFSSAITRLVCTILPDLPFCDLMPISDLTSCCHMFLQYRRFVSSRGRGISGYCAFVDGCWAIYALVTGSARMPSASNLRRASSRAQVWMLISVSYALLMFMFCLHRLPFCPPCHGHR